MYRGNCPVSSCPRGYSFQVGGCPWEYLNHRYIVASTPCNHIGSMIIIGICNIWIRSKETYTLKVLLGSTSIFVSDWFSPQKLLPTEEES